jgi:hypothetical protein
MKKHKSLTVINFFAGPGSGKSTCSAGLFYLMKHQYYNVELVTEYAKELVWREQTNTNEMSAQFNAQDYIFSKQHNKITHLAGKVEFAITDSPLLLSLVYCPDTYPKSFAPFVTDVFNSYNNINIFLERKKKYVKIGRNQSESEAREVDDKIKNMLDEKEIPYHIIAADIDAPQNIINLLKTLGYDNKN